MNITDNQLNAIVDRVVEQLANPQTPQPDPTPAPETPRRFLPPHPTPASPQRGCFPSVQSAIIAAEQAFHEYRSISLEKRKHIIAAIRAICLDHLPQLARIALDETGLGRYHDKLKKNELAIRKTPGVEDLEPSAFTGDHGLTLHERAPWGVIGSITPCTNPSETIICNAIGMIAGGNAVTFNPHPSAKLISAFTVDLLNRAVISENGPPNLFTTIADPSISSAQTLMKHPKIPLLVVTGGPAVVAEAMKSGKRVIAAGPGNPPVVVDESADITKAANDIISSASCDNNIICVVEKEIIATQRAADPLKKALLASGAIELGQYQTKRLEKILLSPNGLPNKQWIGKDIQLILQQIGINPDPSIRLAIIETNPNHPFARLEMLMPILPFIRVRDIHAAIDLAYELEAGCFHTAVIHSRNVEHLHHMAVKMNTSILVKNGPALAGLGLDGEGPTSFTIASPTGEGLTTARHFTRTRRCVLSGSFRIV